MSKLQLKPAVGLRPVPVVLVTSVDYDGRPNVITLAWAGVVCSVPPMVSISVRGERFSHDLIRNCGQFVVNLPSADMLWATDYCGNHSGRDEDKLAATGLKPIAASNVKPPLIEQCPINIECVVRHQLALGSHDLFVGEVVALQADESALDEKGNLSAAKAQLLAYDQPEYSTVGRVLGRLGLSKSPQM